MFIGCRSVSPGYTNFDKRMDIKAALDHLTDEYSDMLSDSSVDDNDKIYGVPEPILQCNKCSRTFLNQLSLRVHEKQHIEQNFSCYECGQRFSFLEDLKDHRRNHLVDMTTDCNDDIYVAKAEMKMEILKLEKFIVYLKFY